MDRAVESSRGAQEDLGGVVGDGEVWLWRLLVVVVGVVGVVVVGLGHTDEAQRLLRRRQETQLDRTRTYLA